MIKMDVFLLDNLNNTKEEIKILKPKSYDNLLKQIGKKFKNISEYYDIFILDENNEEIKIDTEEEYEQVGDILFIREIDKNILEQSMFEINFNKLSESNKNIVEEKYNCKICSMIIKNENPYFCYNCQKIFHEKCLKNWDRTCKSQQRDLTCPNCRNVSVIENWKKKLDYEENRKQIADLINKINENKLNNNINIIRDKKIKELKLKNMKQHDIIKYYEKYIEKTIEIFKHILNEINIIRFILNIKNNKKLNELIVMYPLNLQNLKIDEISEEISEELKHFKIYFIHKLKLDINAIIINYNKMMNKIKKKSINNNINIREVENNLNINNNNSEENSKESLSFNKKKQESIIHNNYINDIKDNNDKMSIDDINENINEYRNRINLIYTVSIRGDYDIFGNQFVENNKKYIELIINNQRCFLTNKFYLKEGDTTITMIIKTRLTDLNCMFESCKRLKNIDELKNLNVKGIKNFSYMFYGCSSLSNINSLKNWDVSSSKTFESMFESCPFITDIKPLQNWNTSNCKNFSSMFSKCSRLSEIKPLKNWIVSNGINFESMFLGCNSLSDIYPLQNWNVSRAENFEDMFRECISLSDISPLKYWDVSYAHNFEGMFWGCKNLSDISPLEDWSINDEDAINDMFFECSVHLDIKPLQNWNISKENLDSIK